MRRPAGLTYNTSTVKYSPLAAFCFASANLICAANVCAAGRARPLILPPGFHITSGTPLHRLVPANLRKFARTISHDGPAGTAIAGQHRAAIGWMLANSGGAVHVIGTEESLIAVPEKTLPFATRTLLRQPLNPGINPAWVRFAEHAFHQMQNLLAGDVDNCHGRLNHLFENTPESFVQALVMSVTPFIKRVPPPESLPPQAIGSPSQTAGSAPATVAELKSGDRAMVLQGRHPNFQIVTIEAVSPDTGLITVSVYGRPNRYARSPRDYNRETGLAVHATGFHLYAGIDDRLAPLPPGAHIP